MDCVEESSDRFLAYGKLPYMTRQTFFKNLRLSQAFKIGFPQILMHSPGNSDKSISSVVGVRDIQI